MMMNSAKHKKKIFELHCFFDFLYQVNCSSLFCKVNYIFFKVFSGFLYFRILYVLHVTIKYLQTVPIAKTINEHFNASIQLKRITFPDTSKHVHLKLITQVQLVLVHLSLKFHYFGGLS